MDEASAPYIVEWFRPDRTRLLLRVWIVAASFVSLGVVLIAMTRVDTLPAEWRVGLGVLGGLFTVSGPIAAVIGFQRAIGDDTWLALRGDGLMYCNHGVQSFVAWEAIDDTTLDETTRVIRIIGPTGTLLNVSESFSGLSPLQLRERIASARRRALMGLLRPR